MSNPEKINTILTRSQSQIKVKGSLFIGQVIPVSSSNDAEDMLSEIRKTYYDAIHNCYSYKIIDEKDFRYSDDGEPNGTAGIRIYNAVNHFNLSNVLIVSTRYYGGTKLGVGPLGKAYYNSAYQAITSSNIIKQYNYAKITIEFDFNMTSHVHHFINQFEVKNIENLYEEKPKIKCFIKQNFVTKFSTELELISKGSIQIDVLDKNFYM